MGSMRAVVLGERMNLRPMTRSLRKLLTLGDEEWARFALRMGAFRDDRSLVKLASVGLAGARGINLLPPSPQEVPWDGQRARRVAALICVALAEDPTPVVYAAGGRVAAALLLPRRGPLRNVYGVPLESPLLPGVPVVPIPHPSGLNLWWNDRRQVEALRLKIKESHHAQDRPAREDEVQVGRGAVPQAGQDAEGPAPRP